VAEPWDRRTAQQQAGRRDAAIAEQVGRRVGPASPFYRDRLAALGTVASAITDLRSLQRLPAVGERDVCPDGDPVAAARLVVRTSEAGWVRTSSGPTLRRGLSARLRRAPAYELEVEGAVRPTSYTFGGLAMTLPIASTRDDLDIVARAGARLWSVLGLTGADVMVSALPTVARVEHTALMAAALAASAPALAPGEDPDGLAEVLALVPPTVLALPADTAADLLSELAGAVPESVRTVLLVGAVDDALRAQLADELPEARALQVWGPPDGRWLWGEAKPGGGLVSYPDLEVLEVVDPRTGEPAGRGDGGELVLSQLGVSGTALLRWRTGALLPGPLAADPGAAGGRTVPLVPPGLRLGELVVPVDDAGTTVLLDLRAVDGALAGAADVAAWRSEVVSTRGRDGLVVRLRPAEGSDPKAVGTAAAADVLAAAGLSPVKVVIDRRLA